MSKPKVLVQLDSDPLPSVFDSVVAIDAGVDQLLRQSPVTPETVRDLVYGAIFTRGVDDLSRTAIFIGGSKVAAGEALLAKVRETFFGPMRVSVMLDSNGANTTAAAAVWAAAQHVPLKGATALVLGGTGPVGRRVARLLIGEGAVVRIGSRDQNRAEEACRTLRGDKAHRTISSCSTSTANEIRAALDGVQIVFAAGAPGVLLLSDDVRRQAASLAVAIDLNAVPPLGIAGIEATDKAKHRDNLICYGALGIGGTKMNIHKAAIRRLFESNDQVLDAEQIFQLAQEQLS